MILFVNRNLRKATSIKKINQVLFSFELDNVDKYQRDRLFSSDMGIVNLHLSERTHWVVYNNEKFFDIYD